MPFYIFEKKKYYVVRKQLNQDISGIYLCIKDTDYICIKVKILYYV